MIGRCISGIIVWFLITATSASSAAFDYTTLWAHVADSEVPHFLYDCGGLVDVAVKGNFAYAVDDFYGLQTIDYSDPQDIVYRGFINLSNYPERCDVRDHFVYVIDNVHQINVIDVDDHDDLVLVNQVDAGSDLNDVLVFGPWLYVAINTGELQTYSLETASAPMLVNTLTIPPQYARRLALDDERIIAAGDAGLLVINTAVPNWPTIIGSYDFSGNTRDLAVRDGLAVVGQLTQSRFLDISEPTNITEIALLPETGTGVYLTSNDQVWLGHEDCWHHGGMRIYDVSEPASPVWLYDEIEGFRGAPHAMVEYQGFVFAAEHMCWCAGEWPGFHIFRIGDLPPPSPLATSSHDRGYGMLLNDTRVDLATGSGFVAVDMSDPGDPQTLQVFDPSHGYWRPAEDDGVVICTRFYSNYQYWLQVLTRDSDNNLVHRGDLPVNDYARSMAISGATALAAFVNGPGLWVLDVSDPDTLVVLAELYVGEDIGSVALHGDLAAVWSSGTTRILDISDHDNPVLLSSWESGDSYHLPAHQFVERTGRLFLLASNLTGDSEYDGAYAEIHDLTDPAIPVQRLALRQLANDQTGHPVLQGELIIVPGARQLTLYEWPDINEQAAFLGRIPLPEPTSYFAARSIIMDQAIVVQQIEGMVSTWPLPSGVVTSVDGDESVPSVDIPDISVFPNPFNPACEIRFTLPAGDDVTVQIFDGRGYLIQTLLQARVRAGQHTLRWNGRDRNGHAVATGVYLARIRAGSVTTSAKLTLAR